MGGTQRGWGRCPPAGREEQDNWATGKTLTSAPVSTKRHRPLVRSVTKNRRLGDRSEVFVAINTRPGCFPSTNRGGALAGSVTKLVVIPAEAGTWGVLR